MNRLLILLHKTFHIAFELTSKTSKAFIHSFSLTHSCPSNLFYLIFFCLIEFLKQRHTMSHDFPTWDVSVQTGAQQHLSEHISCLSFMQYPFQQLFHRFWKFVSLLMLFLGICLACLIKGFFPIHENIQTLYNL